METVQEVLEYKCPHCGGGLTFGQENQSMHCPYCESDFDLEAVLEQEKQIPDPEIQWDHSGGTEWSENEKEKLVTFVCPNCGGQLTTDANTAATFCPYCDNPAVIPGRVADHLKPDGVIPFRTSKEDAVNAFRKLCQGKPLLPKFFTEDHRVEKISGIYVPFWLYDCKSDFSGSYKATRVHHWSDSKYIYTRTEYYHLLREADAEFVRIPMDASVKMDNAIMESIEPFDYSQLVDFETAYLSGFLADKYDVEAKDGEDRVRSRVQESMHSMVGNTLLGYSTVVPMTRNLNVSHGNAKYVLLPVWMLHTRYQDKTYVFAMNGQTGKITGTFPICPRRTAAWFCGICAGVTALLTLILSMFG